MPGRPQFAACLVARDLDDAGDDSERRFEFVLSHKRDLAVATSLMSRIDPAWTLHARLDGQCGPAPWVSRRG